MTDDYNKFIMAFKDATRYMTCREVAEKMCCGQTSVYNWLNRDFCMNADAVLRACRVFKIDLSKILTEG